MDGEVEEHLPFFLAASYSMNLKFEWKNNNKQIEFKITLILLLLFSYFFKFYKDLSWKGQRSDDVWQSKIWIFMDNRRNGRFMFVVSDQICLFFIKYVVHLILLFSSLIGSAFIKSYPK